VRHDNGLVTVYGHASELKVNRGDNVTRGQVIAASGMTGTATQPKVHFEVRENATPVDPTRFLD
jgi:murein DD-endopeptidase MepM/ murein hydrolase activator NlpD